MESSIVSGSEIARLVRSLELSLRRISEDLNKEKEFVHGDYGLIVNKKGINYFFIDISTGQKFYVSKNKISLSKKLSILTLAGREMLRDLMSKKKGYYKS